MSRFYVRLMRARWISFSAPIISSIALMAGTGSQALKDFLHWAKGAAPDCKHVIKRSFADGDHVVEHTHVTIEPGTRGNAVIDIFRVQDGLIAEHWDVIQEVPAESRNDNGMF
jgi:predicted SnoaL-like aldol condensation-catalyzing enzyme